MPGIYTSYKCKTCSKEFVLLSEDIDSMTSDSYLACPYCNSKRVLVENAADSVKECMKEHSYVRSNRVIRQRR